MAKKQENKTTFFCAQLRRTKLHCQNYIVTTTTTTTTAIAKARAEEKAKQRSGGASTDTHHQIIGGKEQHKTTINAGTITSVAPKHHFEHIMLNKIRPEDPQTLTSVNGESLQIYGTIHVTMIHNKLAIPTTFIIARQYSKLGLDTISNNNLKLGYKVTRAT
eukprot:53409-Amphidinium_carterae.1